MKGDWSLLRRRLLPTCLRYGWATGIYYLNLNIAIQSRNAPDPVFQLRTLYDQWRKKLIGRPDHHLSSVTLSTSNLPADGRTGADAMITLRDSTGKSLGGSGAKLTIFYLLLQLTNSSMLPSSFGALDSSGRAQAGFVTPPGILSPLRGRSLTFAWASLVPIYFASNPVIIAIG